MLLPILIKILFWGCIAIYIFRLLFTNYDDKESAETKTKNDLINIFWLIAFFLLIDYLLKNFF